MKRDWWKDEFRTLVTMGESTTAGGWSSSRQRCWASQLALLINQCQRVPVQLVNVGLGANVISTKSPAYPQSGKPAASERLEKHVLLNRAFDGTTYGLNDARSGTPIDLFCDEMKDIIRRIRERTEPLIVLLGPYYMTDFTLGGPRYSHGSLKIFHEYNDAIRSLAQEYGCLFVDLLEPYRRADWLVHHDGCHANDLGHRIVANKIFEVLASSCSGLAKETRALEDSIPPWRDESTLKQ